VNELKQRYFIPNIRTAVKTVWNNCQRCKNEKAQPIIPEMGQLPSHRLESFGAPFHNTGMDYFGPITVTVGRRLEKRYGVLFTCLSTRAVHLEVAHSLSTDSCLLAIRKFICRRGCPEHIYSDNGTNFVGVDNELKKLNQDTMTGDCTSKGITWHFNPPAAPHMGGSWERLVRSVKVALYAALKQKNPKDEILQTLMVEAEHVVNCHPLTHVSLDPDDEEALTPNHFLMGRSSNVQPLAVSAGTDANPREMWKQSEKLADKFWHRWSKEYLPTLLKRTKWHRPSKPVKEGDVVIIMCDNEPRGLWPMGIVKKSIPRQRWTDQSRRNKTGEEHLQATGSESYSVGCAARS